MVLQAAPGITPEHRISLSCGRRYSRKPCANFGMSKGAWNRCLFAYLKGLLTSLQTFFTLLPQPDIVHRLLHFQKVTTAYKTITWDCLFPQTAPNTTHWRETVWDLRAGFLSQSSYLGWVPAGTQVDHLFPYLRVILRNLKFTNCFRFNIYLCKSESSPECLLIPRTRSDPAPLPPEETAVDFRGWGFFILTNHDF